MRDGVGPSCVALPVGPWTTVVEFLIARFPSIPAEVWAQRIDGGEVVDENGVPVTPTRPHHPHLRVYYYRALPPETRIPFDEVVLFQDEHLVVADKPHFLPVTPAGGYLQETLLIRLRRRLGIESLTPIHRIDRETAGVVLLSVDASTRGRYQQLFAERRVRKRYECTADWRPELELPLIRRSRIADDPTHFMRMIETPGECNSETRIELMASSDGLARYGLTPLTGRRHQLRLHCASIGIPILGDRIYPRLMPPSMNAYENPLQLLARSVSFADPMTGSIREFESLRQLRPLLPTESHQ